MKVGDERSGSRGHGGGRCIDEQSGWHGWGKRRAVPSVYVHLSRRRVVAFEGGGRPQW